MSHTFQVFLETCQNRSSCVISDAVSDFIDVTSQNVWYEKKSTQVLYQRDDSIKVTFQIKIQSAVDGFSKKQETFNHFNYTNALRVDQYYTNLQAVAVMPNPSSGRCH